MHFLTAAKQTDTSFGDKKNFKGRFCANSTVLAVILEERDLNFKK